MIVPLKAGIQHYAWGDKGFIPDLLGIENQEGRPFAELWMGSHPDLPSKIELEGRSVGLDEFIAMSGDEVLGPAISQEFGGQLPYLFKVLSADAPLSIQAHPSKECARKGFNREEAAGIPISAGNRNYRDANHKPELIVALTPFYGLKGFRPLQEIARVHSEVPEFREFWPDFEPTSVGLREFYGAIMHLPQGRVNTLLGAIQERLADADSRNRFTTADREYWILKSNREYATKGDLDRGIFSIYLLNLVRLKPGEGMYLPAGVLHAYLQGTGLEIMANSNNVIRGGLTPKHVDVPELLNNVVFEGAAPEILKPTQVADSRQWVFQTPAREFELHRIEIALKQPHRTGPDHSAEILIITNAEDDALVTVSAERQSLEFSKGGVFFVPSGTSYAISSDKEAVLYKATVPLNPAPLFRGRRPKALAFGTSGLRGLVTDITDLETYINTKGFLDYLYRIGEATEGDAVCLAGDLRPSTEDAKGGIMHAVARAIDDAGLRVENLGKLPTPALTCYGLQNRCASIMVTGSHIPFDRNGIKFNRVAGEVLKADERGILEAVAGVRLAEYNRPAADSLFQDNGAFKEGRRPVLPPVNDSARLMYLRRYLDFFAPQGLKGLRIVFFQHTAVGRDLLVELFESLGAEVIPAGRSEEFVAIDTEDITQERLDGLQEMVDDVIRDHGPVHALVSTDGDSDRPLLLGVDTENRLRFYGGDLLGIVVADYLDPDSISVPISTNDAVDLHFMERNITPGKTRIGSPYVIKSMLRAKAKGMSRIVGWEANGGFLTGSVIRRKGQTLEALPTRDAVLPILAALYSSTEQQCTLVELFDQLPPRFSKAGLIDAFPLETSRKLIGQFSPADEQVWEVRFDGKMVTLVYADHHSEAAPGVVASGLQEVRQRLGRFFTPQDGFDSIVRINSVDGIRIFFRNGDIAHIRPSGNAPQLRIYAVANTQVRADGIVELSLREPDGILRRMEAEVGG